jgi:hypothetical protein
MSPAAKRGMCIVSILRSGRRGWLALGLLSIAAPASAQHLWRPRASVELPYWTAAVGGPSTSFFGKTAQFMGGFGLELAAERDVARGLSAGASAVVMERMWPNIYGCETGGFDECGDPLAHSIGVFGTIRQYLPRSSSGAHLAAMLGAGFYRFGGEYLGRHLDTSGPALLYGAEGETPSVMRLSAVASIRAQYVVDPTASPLHVTTVTLGIRLQ